MAAGFSIQHIPSEWVFRAVSLAALCFAGLFWWLANRSGVLYLLGTPVTKQKESGQFWFIVSLVCAGAVILGVFLLWISLH